MSDRSAADALSSAPRVPEHGAFFGPFGLRAGWALLLFSVIFGLLLSGSFFAYTHWTGAGRDAQKQYRTDTRTGEEGRRAHPSSAPSAPPQPAPARADKRIRIEAGQTSMLLLATVVMARLERRRFGVFGLGHFRVRHLVGGAFTGVLALSMLVGVLRALHVLVFDRRLLGGAAAWHSGLVWLMFFAVVGLFEEFFFRGYIQYTLMRGLYGLAERIAPQTPGRAAFWLAAGLWSVLFLSGHIGNPGENATGLLAVFVAGIVFSYALWRTGSLWWGIGFHMTWDWSESFLYGVPDSGILSAGRLFATHPAGHPLLSGGSDGPEGSVLVLPALLLTALVLRWGVRPAAASAWERRSFLPEPPPRPTEQPAQ